MGLLGSSLPEKYGCAGLNGVSYGLICQELERGDSGIRSFVSRAELAVHVPDLRLRQRRAAHALAARHGGGQGDRLLRPDRAARRLRPGQHEDACPPRRRRLGHQRLARCGSPTATWPTSPSSGRRPTTASRASCVEKGMPGFTAQEIKHKMTPARLGHQRAVLRQRARAGCQPPAQREGPEGPAGLPDPGPLRHHLGPDRRRHRLPGRSARTTPRSASCSAARWPPPRARRSRWPTWPAASPWRSCCRCSWAG